MSFVNIFKNENTLRSGRKLIILISYSEIVNDFLMQNGEKNNKEDLAKFWKKCFGNMILFDCLFFRYCPLMFCIDNVMYFKFLLF